jgi:hypothetical protein
VHLTSPSSNCIPALNIAVPVAVDADDEDKEAEVKAENVLSAIEESYPNSLTIDDMSRSGLFAILEQLSPIYRSSLNTSLPLLQCELQ